MESKRAQAKVIVLIILILLIISLIILVWNFLSLLIKEQTKSYDIRTELLNTKIGIKDLDVGGDHINITVKRGPEKIILVNETTLNITVNYTIAADIVSVADVSGSMGQGTGWSGECLVNSSSPCCINNDCTTSIGCLACGGLYSGGRCYLEDYLEDYVEGCCASTNCSVKTNCESCGGLFSSWTEWNGVIHKRCYTDNDYSRDCCSANDCNLDAATCNLCEGYFNLYPWCSNYDSGCCDNLDCDYNRTVCESVCNGDFYEDIYCNYAWRYDVLSSCSTDILKCKYYCHGNFRNKIDISKEAHINFIEDVFNVSSRHRIGLVTFESFVVDTHPLSRDKSSLTNEINSWKARGGTDASKGIKRAITMLSSSSAYKVMIVMSDGVTSETSAVDAARDAWGNHSIRVYSIGLGEDVNEGIMQNIADAGNGTYSFSDISGLSEAYTQVGEDIIEQLIREYESEKKYTHVKFIVYNETTTWIHPVYEVPTPLGSKEFKIPVTGEPLSRHIINPTKIEIYFAVYDDEGNEIISPVLDVWEFD
jgi:hypothetical protein